MASGSGVGVATGVRVGVGVMCGASSVGSGVGRLLSTGSGVGLPGREMRLSRLSPSAATVSPSTAITASSIISTFTPGCMRFLSFFASFIYVHASFAAF